MHRTGSSGSRSISSFPNEEPGMRASNRLKGLAIVLAMSAGAIAAAAPLGFYNGMRDTPITKFDKADMALMTKAVYGALDTGADGVKVSWENPGTDSSGS